MTNIKFEDDLYLQLQDPEFQREWLRQTAMEYIQQGNFEMFFSDLEDVIKATSTITQYAEKIGIDRVQLTKILKGTTKSPSLPTVNKILSGFGLSLSVTDLKSA